MIHIYIVRTRIYLESRSCACARVYVCMYVCMYVCFLHVYVASDSVQPLALRCMCIKNPLLPRVIFWEKRYCNIVHVYSCMYMSMESHD